MLLSVVALGAGVASVVFAADSGVHASCPAVGNVPVARYGPDNHAGREAPRVRWRVVAGGDPAYVCGSETHGGDLLVRGVAGLGGRWVG
ncbi:hypothetical protein Abr02nite_80050 [Paractinoplanes brasiliensis]|nr:hypothetical protein Abr02nite_80050 [Actinoplanes brasiliensis]